jgi:hypothetical protein
MVRIRLGIIRHRAFEKLWHRPILKEILKTHYDRKAIDRLSKTTRNGETREWIHQKTIYFHFVLFFSLFFKSKK